MADSNAVLRDRLLQRPIVPLPIPTTTVDQPLTSKPCLLVGWSLRETTGSAAATAEFQSSQKAGGATVGEQQLTSGASDTRSVSNEGLLCEVGLMIHVIAGSVVGTAWVRI